MVSTTMAGLSQNQVDSVAKHEAGLRANRSSNWFVLLTVILAFFAGFYFGRIDSSGTSSDAADGHSSYGRFGHR